MRLVVKNEMYKIGLILKGATDTTIKKSVARSANRAATTLRSEAARRLKQRYNLPISGSSKGGGGTTPPGIKPNILIQKTSANKGKPIERTVAIIRVQDTPISMIHFVRGSKTPAPQKGISIKQRRPVKVQITRGNTRVLPRAFILKANNSMQVYRMGRGTTRVKQAVPSLFKLIMKPELKKPLEAIGSAAFTKEMERNLAYFMSRQK